MGGKGSGRKRKLKWNESICSRCGSVAIDDILISLIRLGKYEQDKKGMEVRLCESCGITKFRGFTVNTNVSLEDELRELVVAYFREKREGENMTWHDKFFRYDMEEKDEE